MAVASRHTRQSGNINSTWVKRLGHTSGCWELVCRHSSCMASHAWHCTHPQVVPAAPRRTRVPVGSKLGVGCPRGRRGRGAVGVDTLRVGFSLSPRDTWQAAGTAVSTDNGDTAASRSMQVTTCEEVVWACYCWCGGDGRGLWTDCGTLRRRVPSKRTPRARTCVNSDCSAGFGGQGSRDVVERARGPVNGQCLRVPCKAC